MLTSDTRQDTKFNLDSESRSTVNQQKTQPSVFSRALSLSTYFLSGVFSINVSQILGTPLYLINEDWYNAWIAFTKQSFGVLTMGLTQAFAPTTVVVSGDASVRGQLQQSVDGNLKLKFPERMVLIANHQIYTDWLYLWWIAYCNGVHGRLYIILKESLKRIPVIGWGMQLSQFIFLKRDWEKDKPHMAQALQRLNTSREPMWLLLFPEGTNLASCTRKKSSGWAAKSGIKDTKHVLLPRSTGLQFCLEQLESSVEYLYDCTIAYEGVRRGEYAQDIFTLKAGYLEGKPPKSVSMYWRRFAIKDIPVHNQKVFQLWLTARWREKDLLIENYLRFGRFPGNADVRQGGNDKHEQEPGLLRVQIRPSHWYEFLQIFAPMGVLAMVLFIFYGALPQKVWDTINNDAVKQTSNDLKRLQTNTRDVSGALNMDAFFDKNKQGNAFKGLGSNMLRVLQSPEATSFMNRANMVQRWLEDPQKFILDNLEHLETDKPRQTFMQRLEDEQKRRQGKASYQGTFWKDLEALEKARVQQQLDKPVLAATIGRRKPPKLGPSMKKRVQTGLFWESLKAEENTRCGSEIAVSSKSSNEEKLAKARSVPSSGLQQAPTTKISHAKKSPDNITG